MINMWQQNFAKFPLKQSCSTITHPPYVTDIMVATAIAFIQWSKRDLILPSNFFG